MSHIQLTFSSTDRKASPPRPFFPRNPLRLAFLLPPSGTPEPRPRRIVVFVRLGPAFLLRREDFRLHLEQSLFDLLVLLLDVLDHLFERLLGGDVDGFL